MVLKIIKGRVDGMTIHLEEPVDLPKDTAVNVRVERLHANDSPQPSAGAWTSLRALADLEDGPADWSTELDHYLYGLPKRREAEQP